MIQRLVASLFAVLPLIASGQTIGLVDGYKLMLDHDPSLAAARHEYDASQADADSAISALLPQIGFTAARSVVRGSNSYPGNGTTLVQSLSYNSNDYLLTLTQPIFNMSAWRQYQEGKLRRQLSDVVLDSRRSDAVVRYFSAYLDVVLAIQNIELAKRQVITLEQLLVLARRSRSGGEGSSTDIDDAQARLDLAQATRIDAENTMVALRKRLADQIGMSFDAVKAPDQNLPLEIPEPAKVEDWIAKAVIANPGLRAGEKNIEISKTEIDRINAGHYPTVDMVLQSERALSQSVATLDQHTKDSSIGFQINVPIYSGGAVSASVRAAAARWEQAQSSQDQSRYDVEQDVVRQFAAITGGINRIKALRIAVNSSEKALQSNRIGVKAGVRVHVDILNAEQQLYEVRRDLAQAVNSYLLSWVLLKADAGVLSLEDIVLMDGVFTRTID